MQELGASNITGVVGPHICGECYEVDPQMYADITKTPPSNWWKAKSFESVCRAGGTAI